MQEYVSMSPLSTGLMVSTGPLPTSPPAPAFLTQRDVGGGLASAVQVKITESVSSNNGSGEDVTTVTFGGTRLDIVGLVHISFLCSAFLVIGIIHIVEHLQYVTTSTASGALTPKALVAVQV